MKFNLTFTILGAIYSLKWSGLSSTQTFLWAALNYFMTNWSSNRTEWMLGSSIFMIRHRNQLPTLRTLNLSHSCSYKTGRYLHCMRRKCSCWGMILREKWSIWTRRSGTLRATTNPVTYQCFKGRRWSCTSLRPLKILEPDRRKGVKQMRSTWTTEYISMITTATIKLKTSQLNLNPL